MNKALIIVESPAKIRTLRKFLGADYSFESSIGHIRDLPQKEFGIDVEHDFEPHYITMPDKKEVIEKLRSAAKKVDLVLLSPDPDREGEAIAWHIASILPKGVKYKRISFQSITKDEVKHALAHPRDIDMDLVNAQQARRLLDRMVGYKISPILTRKVKRGSKGTSAGRVQSAALKLVVNREKEIDAFDPIEYWNIGAVLESKSIDRPFLASIHSVNGLKVEKEEQNNKEVFLISNEKTAKEIVTKLKSASYTISSVEKKERKRNPVPPCITSTLQQEASRHYGFSASRTMGIAQGLYEGIDMGPNGSEGLITYMRTDSVNIAPEAIASARKYIENQFGSEYLPQQPRLYASKKTAQEAHEAIRPTNVYQEPEQIRQYLSSDQYKIYLLIWRRFVASQMNPAIYDTVSVDVSTDQNILLRATGSTLKFNGFLAVYEEKKDRSLSEDEDAAKLLPPLEAHMPITLVDVMSEQSFTKPPPRFSEASLVKELERIGIGRPSTYAAIMNKIQSRDYTTKENQALKPTELGKVITQMLEENFHSIMDITFTAQMEDQLELVAEHKKDWKELIRNFWKDFLPLVEKAEKEAVVPKLLTEIDCPKCHCKLQKIWSRNKYFYGCSDYPTCDFTSPIEAIGFDKSEYDPSTNWEPSCPQCSAQMTLRYGRSRPFFGCSSYPECKGIVNIYKKGEKIYKPEDLPACPAIGCNGHLTVRRSRFGKAFFSCSNYPDCNVIVSALDQLKTKYVDHPKTAYVKKKGGGKEGKSGGKSTKKLKKEKESPEKKKKAKKQPAYKLSPELSALLGHKELSRPDVVKQIWVYIKEHQLQDPANKQLIIPDDALAKVFHSKEPIHMMKLAGQLSKHIKK